MYLRARRQHPASRISKLEAMNEAEFIAALRRLPLHPGARELKDDAAVVELGGLTLVLTHDTMAEGTHFGENAALGDVAWKLVASNLSDLAAKGAQSYGMLLSYSLGRDDEAFLQGLHEALSVFDLPILGGDTVASTAGRTIGITAIGVATYTPVPSRSGARIGDAIYVTGALGEAMLGFEGVEEHLDAFERPIPRYAEGPILAPIVTAMMDVSDGLLLDAFRMAEASEASFAIDSSAVPVADPQRRDECLRWGDDYELLFTAPPGVDIPVPATKIGQVEPRGFAPLFLDGHPLTSSEGLGYSHG